MSRRLGQGFNVMRVISVWNITKTAQPRGIVEGIRPPAVKGVKITFDQLYFSAAPGGTLRRRDESDSEP
jgi:hypothetical protein